MMSWIHVRRSVGRPRVIIYAEEEAFMRERAREHKKNL